MHNEHIEISSPAAAPLMRRSAEAPQLLIAMPGEAAVRLWMRSLLDRAAQSAETAANASDEQGRVTVPDAWRTTTHRLATCATLYAHALSGSLTRKSLRRLRELRRRAARLDRASEQLAWLKRTPETALGPATLWLTARTLRSESDFAVSRKRATRDAAKLRSIAKTLSVYTTAVKLDDMRQPSTFAELTATLLEAEATRASKHVLNTSLANNRSARRALASTQRLAFLLEPVHMHLDDAAGVVNAVGELQTDLERLAMLQSMASAIARAGRRAGAMHMSSALRHALFGRAPDADVDWRPELLSLAWRLRAELTPAFNSFAAKWLQSGRSSELAVEVARRAHELR